MEIKKQNLRRTYSVDDLQLKSTLTRNKVLIEGYLKKINRLFNDKGYYRVIGNEMFIASKPHKKFRIAYNLTHYMIKLSARDNRRFTLTPVDPSMGLSVIKFDAPTVEERARWFKALEPMSDYSAISNYDDVIMQKRAENPHGEFDPAEMKTLNGISVFLSNQN